MESTLDIKPLDVLMSMHAVKSHSFFEQMKAAACLQMKPVTPQASTDPA